MWTNDQPSGTTIPGNNKRVPPHAPYWNPTVYVPCVVPVLHEQVMH